MRRALCLSVTLLRLDKPVNVVRNVMSLVKDFKEWRMRQPPSYAALPIDHNEEYNVPMAVKDAVFSKVPTEPLLAPLRLVCVSEDALSNLLDLDPNVAECECFIDFLAGKYLPEGGMTVCHRYGGYQFGFWADQLGDGRAHILGEYENRAGQVWQLQLKGSGETPYSRFGDGRAVLRSSLRELVGCEAAHALGLPTTRAAGLVVSETHTVWRDQTYSGRERRERAAVLLRLAPAWYRLGSLEILHRRNEHRLLKDLVDFIIKHHFSSDECGEGDYVRWFELVAHRNLDMVAAWQGVGFVHGVLNTDNVSVLGLTLDYGPYGFMESYNEHYSPNRSDDAGRYAYNKQPTVMVWNLHKFAEALQPILTEEQKKRIADIAATLEEYVNRKILETFVIKLGLSSVSAGDEELVRELLALMQDTSADFIGTFRQLAEVALEELTEPTVLEQHWALKQASNGARGAWPRWVQRYIARVRHEQGDGEGRRARARRACPRYAPRAWLLHDAIKDAEDNRFDKVRLLVRVLRRPFESDAEAERAGFATPPPAWSLALRLSCSS